MALVGRAGTGKTTVAEALVKAGVCDLRASFAGELKADLRALGVEKGQPHAREVMIAYGQNRRAVNADYWIERLREKLRDDFGGVAIDDVRFANEVAFLRRRGFLIVKLVARGDVRIDRGIPLDFVTSMDVSESELDSELGDIIIDTGMVRPGECAATIAGVLQRGAA